MRLWVVSPSYPSHPKESINAGVLARDLALHAAASGHEVVVVTPDKPGGLRVDAGLGALPIPWIAPTTRMSDLSARRPLDLLRILSLFVAARATLSEAARRRPPDAILALWALPSGIFARWVAKSRGVPYAVWLLGSDVWNAPSYPGGVRTLRRVLADATARFADGRELAGRALELTGQEVAFLPSIRRLPPAEPDPFAPADLLFVGRFHRNKGPDVLLEAFAMLAEERPSLTLRLHGSGELEPWLLEQSAAPALAGRVVIGRPLSAAELAGALAATRLLVIPSRVESIPLILGDAAQSGTRVVATAVGDMPEVINELDLGELAAPGDPSDLARAISRALDLGAAGPLPGARSDLPGEVFDRLLASVADAPRARDGSRRAVEPS
jgi:glycosyltransferase involved in cell wall biosynthesis